MSDSLISRSILIIGYYWHCGAEYLKRYDVRLSVCLPSMGPQHQAHCCRFAAVRPADRRYRSIAAAAAGECGQCHVVSVRTIGS